MARALNVVIGLGAAAFVTSQTIRVERTNPPVRSDLEAPIEVRMVLRAACYDCHSNETRWPWYIALAPVSWLIQQDVMAGRRRLNFSEWGDYTSDPDTAVQKLSNMRRSVIAGDMAPWYYRLLHSDARLSN